MTDFPEHRPTRRVTLTKDLDDEDVQALLNARCDHLPKRADSTGWDACSRMQDLYYAESKRLSAVVGHMMNAQFALESGGTKREAIDILKRAIALAAAARQGGDVKQAPGEAPQSGGEAVTPKGSRQGSRE